MDSQVKKLWRPDIQVLRALAAGMVVFGHLFPTLLYGGVVFQDSFFVISGFLITSSLLPFIQTKPVKNIFIRFYARRIRRLAPAAGGVFLFLIGCYIFVPGQSLYFTDTFRDIISSALCLENFKLIDDAVDYFRTSNVSTPLLHFWSLSVEEQFYFLWPLLLVIIGFLAGSKDGSQKRFQKIASSIFVILIVISLSFSVYLTYSNQIAAYYNLGTRFWELALGGVCVFILKFLENSSSLLLDFIKRFSTQLVWLFFLGIWVFIVILPINAILPGLWVIIPDICVASILVIGNFDSNKANRLTFTNIFKARFIQLLGDMSYSTYIWHWVLIIMVQRIFPINFDLQFKLFLILVIYFVSFLSYRLIEQNFNKMSTSITHPFYKSPIIKIYLVGVVILVLVIPFSLYKLKLNGNEIAQSVQLAKNASINDECFGAKSFTDSNCELKFNAIDSKYLFSYKDDAFNLIYPECSKPLTDNFCKFGSDDAAKKVLVWGDSHSAHYISLFEEWSKQADVQFTIAIRVGCTHTLKQPVNFHFEDFERREGGSGCVDFNQKVLNDYAPKMDAVIMSSGYAIYTTTNYQEIIEGYTIDAANEHSVNYLENANDELIENVKEILNSKQLEKARNNKHLYILQDTPWTNQSIPYCYTTNFSKCRIQEEAAHVSDFIKQAVDETLNAQFVETANNFCLEKVCYFRIGGTPVYSDYDHLTTSFARSMLGDFKKKIRLD